MPILTPTPPAEDAHLAGFPHGHGWIPLVGYDAACPARPWFGEIRRGTPDGPDVILCGQHATWGEAWASVGDYGRRMLEAWQSEDSTLMTLFRASIKYAKEQR
jgi:hypothetical protein